MLTGHNKAVLQFSGGKDSTALLHLARPWLDRIDVLFVEAGATFPHVRRFVEDTCKALGANLTVIDHGDTLDAYHERAGLPSDVVPFWASPAATPYLKAAPKTKIQEPLRCCNARLYEPAQRFVRECGHTLVLRGSKAADGRVGVGNAVVDGVEYRSPLWGWIDADVMAYLQAEGVELPQHYRDGVSDSLDCWSCTAHLPYHGAEKHAWMRAHTPDLYAALKPRLAAVRAAVADAVAEVDAVMGSAA